MKKNYIAPTMEIIEINGEQLLAGSPTNYSVDKNDARVSDFSCGSNRRSRSTIWDDDDSDW